MNQQAVRDNSPDESAGNFDRFQSFLSEYIFHTDRTSHEQRLFEVTIRDDSIPMLKSVLITIGFLVLVTWPSDFMLFKQSLIVWASIWRAAAVAFSLGLWLALTFSRWARRNVNGLFIGSGTVLVGVAGYCLGQAAQLSAMNSVLTPWFDIAYLIPLLTTLVSVRVVLRLISTITITTVYLVGYLFTFPLSSLNNPYVFSSLITTGTSIVMCTFLGHAIYHLNRRDFFRERKLEEERQKIQKLANHDQLTGLKNFRSFHSAFEREFNRASRYGNQVTLLMMDLDHFKSVNDNYGHLVGDRVLETIGEIIQRGIRTSDLAARYGGEEFTLLLPETSVERATELAERLRTRLKETTFDGGNEDFTVTCSIGLAEYEDGMNEPDDLIRKADRALLKAKEAGRDQVMLNT